MNHQEPKEPVQVVITVDTEPDDAWTHHLNPSVANVQGLRRFQTLLDEYGAKATCLVTYRVVQDDASVDLLRELAADGGAEIGAHLHPWETPPFMDSGMDVRYPTYPHELPLDVFEKKMACLTEAVASKFAQPTCYRAGRWGWVSDHIRVLEALGYLVDTSVVPWEDFRPNWGIPPSVQANGQVRGGPDFRRTLQCPYHPDYSDVGCAGEAHLVEIPVTVAFTRSVPLLVRRRYGALPSLCRRALRKVGLLRPIWAFPSRESQGDLLKMVDVSLAEGRSLINIAIHSSELALGASPRTRTVDQVDRIFLRFEAILGALASRRGCVFTTLSDAARGFCDSERSESASN